jgi:hypothetical protein
MRRIEELVGEKKEKKKDKKKDQQQTWFEISGESFAVEDTRNDQLSRFQALISSSSGMIYARSSDVLVEFGNEIFRTVDTRYFSTVGLYFESTPSENPLESRPQVIEKRPRYLKTSDGLAKVFVAYRFPSVLPEGFLYSVFGLAREVCLRWKHLDPGKFAHKAEQIINRKSGRSVSDTATAEDLAEIIRQVRAGSDVISFHLFFVVYADSEQELKEVSKSLQSTLKLYGVEVESPPFFQHELFEFRTNLGPFFTLKNTITTSTSARVFYPFIKETLAEEGGVFLGFSSTGDPVVFDPYRRQNYLMLILGETGSGKSMTAKAFLSRLYARRKSRIFGIDPESEYSKIADCFGAQRVEISEDLKLGLDPLLLGIDKVTVADVLSEVYGVPRELQPRLRKELMNFSGDILTFAENCSPELRRYLEPATVPPDSNIYTGKPPEVGKSVIFGMRDARSTHVKILTATLISTYLAQTLNKPAVLFVDEGWLFIKMPKLMSVFESVARRGRKYGLLFLFITQRVEDVASTAEGRTLLEQAATVILLRQEREGVELIKDIYKLSPGEANMLVTARPGEGILKASNIKIGIRVSLTQKEFRQFSTTPQV